MAAVYGTIQEELADVIKNYLELQTLYTQTEGAAKRESDKLRRLSLEFDAFRSQAVRDRDALQAAHDQRAAALQSEVEVLRRRQGEAAQEASAQLAKVEHQSEADVARLRLERDADAERHERIRQTSLGEQRKLRDRVAELQQEIATCRFELDAQRETIERQRNAPDEHQILLDALEQKDTAMMQLFDAFQIVERIVVELDMSCTVLQDSQSPAHASTLTTITTLISRLQGALDAVHGTAAD